MKSGILVAAALLAVSATVIAPAAGDAKESVQPAGYDTLVTLYDDFRAIVPPPVANHVPDYSQSAMAERYDRLLAMQRRLAAIDYQSWPVPLQVDYMVIEAEMHGMDFQHRVMRPWQRDPAFYSTTRFRGQRVSRV